MRGKIINDKVAIEKLTIGEPYRDYRALCETLGEKTKTGSSRNAQLRNWGRYFDYKRDGRTYIITKIYEEPKPAKRRAEQTKKKQTQDKIELMSVKPKEIIAKAKREYNRTNGAVNREVSRVVSKKRDPASAPTSSGKHRIVPKVSKKAVKMDIEGRVTEKAMKCMLIQQEISMYKTQSSIAMAQVRTNKEQVKELQGQLREMKKRYGIR